MPVRLIALAARPVRSPAQALRRSAEIDFNREFPAFAAAKWLGHSTGVALKHYTTVVPDELFAKAAGRGAARRVSPRGSSVASRGAQASAGGTTITNLD